MGTVRKSGDSSRDEMGDQVTSVIVRTLPYTLREMRTSGVMKEEHDLNFKRITLAAVPNKSEG